MTEITGHTRIWGILADPIKQVKTPQGLNAIMRARGVDGVMVPMHVGSGELDAFVAGLRGMRNLGGVVVTVPHKTAIAGLCDELTDAGRQSGAVNVVRRTEDGRLIGTMMDGEGFVAGLRAGGIEPRGRSAYLAGAGGAANAIAFALARAGVASLTLANRTREKAEALRDRVAQDYPDLPLIIGSDNPGNAEISVNATSLGLAEGDALPFKVDSLGAGQVVAEIIMQPAVTALMAAAQARGCQVHAGYPMLENQLKLMAEFLGMAA